MANRSDLSPADYPMIRSQGDTVWEESVALVKDGVAWEPTSALAQVREERSRASTLVVDLSASLDGSTLTFGDGVSLDDVDPGTYWWDVQVTDADGTLTIMGGTFTVLADVSDS